MKKFFLTFLIITTPFLALADNPIIELGSVTGVVMDETFREPIPYATISVNSPEGELITGAVSSMDGSFTIDKLPEGKYSVTVQFMGFKSYSSELVISSREKDIEIGTIFLEAEVSQLETVEVVAERSTIEQRIDRKVINVGKDLTTVGPSASDIMGNLPSLTVDQDGNIAMRGNENVRILVDGKPTSIPAAQLLKQIPSTSIKSIELITNPSAKYDPEGMSGIINIILHKNANLGLNGNLNTGVTRGEYTRYNGSLNLNYRSGKFNFYGNLGTNGGESQQLGKIDNFTNNSSENIRFHNDRESYLYKAGVDFYLNDKNTFSIYTNQNFFYGDPLGEVDIIFDGNPESNIYQDFFLENTNISRTYNFDYKRDFRKEGHNIELEVDYNTVDQTELARFEFEGDASSFSNYRDEVRDDLTNTTINLDYVNPLNQQTKLEIGAEARVRNSTNDYQSTNENLAAALYKYDNNIYSFYTTFGQTLEKWSYQLGARLESYDVEAILNNEKIFEDDYITAYPTAFLSYKLSERRSLQLSYGRRVDRPGLHQVNPVREFSTPRITAVGNPLLEPQFTNSLEMNYTHSSQKGNISGGVFYRRIENEINQTLLLDPEDPSRLLLTFLNGEDNSAYGVELNGSYKPVKWWSINPSFEVYSKTERGVVGMETIEVENSAFTFRINQNFDATEKLTFQLFGMYRSPSQMLQFEAEEMYFINAGARYNLLKDKATLSLNFNDIFDTQRFTFDTELPFEQRGSFKPDSQTIFLGFSYRFGGGNKGALQRKNRDENEVQGSGMF